MQTKQSGIKGEDIAVGYLKQLGWIIHARNIRYRFGEIDILAESKGVLVVVEVKMKVSKHYGLAAEMITLRKKQQLLRLARRVAQEYNKPVRIDVIAIDNFATPNEKLTHYPSAIGESYA